MRLACNTWDIILPIQPPTSKSETLYDGGIHAGPSVRHAVSSQRKRCIFYLKVRFEAFAHHTQLLLHNLRKTCTCLTCSLIPRGSLITFSIFLSPREIHPPMQSFLPLMQILFIADLLAESDLIINSNLSPPPCVPERDILGCLPSTFACEVHSTPCFSAAFHVIIVCPNPELGCFPQNRVANNLLRSRTLRLSQD